MKVTFIGTAAQPLDYLARQKVANEIGVDLYIEHHFNSSVSLRANYTLVVVGSNASETSKSLGREYASRIGSRFQVPLGGVDGILPGGFNGRGDGNIRHTKMPALLLEPLFCSHPRSAEIIRSADGQRGLAEVLAETIFESGARHVGFSVGHKYKRSNHNDRGAPINGGGWEADYAELVLKQAADLLEPGDREGIAAPMHEHVVQLGESLWKISQMYRQSVEKLKEWNDLDSDIIHPGQKIQIL